VITDVPGAIPFVTPVELTVATDVLLLAHVPPGVRLFNIVALPWQTDVLPVIGNSALTLTVIVAVQPIDVMYCINDVPAATPVTTPVPGVIVAMPVFPLLHVPPGVASLSVVVLPTQTVATPVIGAIGFTVMVMVDIHPLANT
jgi:hypothetical protein